MPSTPKGGKPAKPLSEKERRFVEAYMGEAAGNATKAAQLAGYGKTEHSSRTLGARLLTKVVIRQAIEARTQVADRRAIADRRERQEFYTELMRNTATAPEVRLKAAQTLGKTEGDEIRRMVIDDPDKVLAELLGVTPSALP